MLKWLANRLTGGDYAETKERLDLVRDSDELLWQTYLKLKDAMSFMARSREAYRQVGQEQKAAASLMGSALEADFDIMKGLREEIAGLQGRVTQLESIERVHLRIIELLEDKVVAAHRSRRGWKWLYEQKCVDWEFQMQENDRLSDHAAHVFEANKNLAEDSAHWQSRLDEALLDWGRERGLRDGWEQTAGELEVELARWKDMFHRTSQGRDENYRAFQQELRITRALQARLDEALVNWDEERGRRVGAEQTANDQEFEIVALMGQVRQSDGNTQRVEAERDALQGLHDDAVNWLTEKAKEGRVRDATIERLEAEVKRLRGGG